MSSAACIFEGTFVSPPPDDPELKAALYLLQDFLKEERRRSARGITLESVHEAILGVGGKVDAQRRQLEIVIRDQIELGLRVDRYGLEIRRLKKHVFGPARESVFGPARESDSDDTPTGQNKFFDEESTGNFRIEEAKRAAEIADLRKRAETQDLEKRESGIWWRRQRYLWVVGAAMVLLAGIVTVGGGLLVFWITHPQ